MTGPRPPRQSQRFSTEQDRIIKIKKNFFICTLLFSIYFNTSAVSAKDVFICTNYNLLNKVNIDNLSRFFGVTDINIYVNDKNKCASSDCIVKIYANTPINKDLKKCIINYNRYADQALETLLEVSGQLGKKYQIYPNGPKETLIQFYKEYEVDGIKFIVVSSNEKEPSRSAMAITSTLGIRVIECVMSEECLGMVDASNE